MITKRTKVQLAIFALITMVGVSFVGARYARLDRLVLDDTYTVTAHLADSGGIFAGAEVSYRGVRVGQVDRLVLTEEGVDAVLDVDNDGDTIPADALAVVGNRSAVGEQYVELQPQSDGEPYLAEGSEIDVDDTRLPIATDTLLTNLSDTVESVNKKDLRIAVSELGAAFGGTGRDLQQIIDAGNGFIHEADANFTTTTELIRNGNTVLRGQIASESAIRSFARDLSLFTGTLAGSDKDLRAVIDNGSATATQLRTFLEDNRVDLAELINNLVTTGEVVVRRLDGVEQILALYPYVVEGGFTVVSKTPATGLYDAHFGMVLTEQPPLCHRGYESTDRRPPQDGSNRPMNMRAHCAEPAAQSNARGSQHAPRPPVVAAYDPERGVVAWGDAAGRNHSVSGSLDLSTMGGKESWRWLYLRPLTGR